MMLISNLKLQLFISTKKLSLIHLNPLQDNSPFLYPLKIDFKNNFSNPPLLILLANLKAGIIRTTIYLLIHFRQIFHFYTPPKISENL